MEHFREGELLPFLTALTERQASVLGHLLACGGCREVALPIAEQLAEAASGVAPAAGATELAQLWPRFARRWEARAAEVAAERAAAGPLADELLAVPVEERVFTIHDQERFQTPAVALTLLDRAGRAADREPAAAEDLAKLALLVVQRLPREGAARDLQSAAWTIVGYALHRKGDPSGAELAFRTASDLLEEQDSFEAAVLARRLAAFRRAGKRAPEALALYQRAVTLFEECGEVAQQGLALEEQGTLYADAGDLERAVGLFSRSFMLSSRGADPAAATRGRLMLAQLLLRFDRAEQAEAVLARADPAALEPALRAVLGVTRAQAAALRGFAAEAERRLAAAFEEALAAGSPAAAAVPAIHLASLAIWRRRPRELERLAPKLAPLLRRGALPPTTRAALRRLRDAAAAGTADRQLVAEVWRETLRALPEGSFRAGLLMLTGQVLAAGPPERGK